MCSVADHPRRIACGHARSHAPFSDVRAALKPHAAQTKSTTLNQTGHRHIRSVARDPEAGKSDGPQAAQGCRGMRATSTARGPRSLCWPADFDPKQWPAYRRGLTTANTCGMRYAVGGGLAAMVYTGRLRQSK